MAATLRELRGRIRSAGSIKKITKAQELIATSRIAKAQARVEAARPYSTEITSMLTELASASALDHPLLVQRENPKRAEYPRVFKPVFEQIARESGHPIGYFEDMATKLAPQFLTWALTDIDWSRYKLIGFTST